MLDKLFWEKENWKLFKLSLIPASLGKKRQGISFILWWHIPASLGKERQGISFNLWWHFTSLEILSHTGIGQWIVNNNLRFPLQVYKSNILFITIREKINLSILIPILSNSPKRTCTKITEVSLIQKKNQQRNLGCFIIAGRF